MKIDEDLAAVGAFTEAEQFADVRRHVDPEWVREALESLHIRRDRRAAVHRRDRPIGGPVRRRVAVAVAAALSAGIALVLELPDYFHLSSLVRSMHDLLMR